MIKYLALHSIPAEVVTDSTQTISEVVTGVSEVLPAERFEIRVTDAKQAAQARELLATAESAAILQAIREKRLQRQGEVTAVCDECGQSSQWPAETMGTTESCPHCGEYMDIPDPDDDWTGVDFGEPEEGEEPEAK